MSNKEELTPQMAESIETLLDCMPDSSYKDRILHKLAREYLERHQGDEEYAEVAICDNEDVVIGFLVTFRQRFIPPETPESLAELRKRAARKGFVLVSE